MPYGWMGTNLEVDLSYWGIEKVKGDPELVRAYLGGKGLNAKILWDRVPPETGPFSPDNLLIIGAGMLTGTPVPGANRTVITYKSPLTEMHSWSAFGGFFAPELKHAGYDTIIIQGKSPTPVYLWINNDQVELRDARHLWGKSTHETRRIIRYELNNDKLQIACIGLAGENRAYAASVEHSAGASASRGGVGAIWGDKNLKAIAVHGSKDVNLANPARLIELCDQVLNRTDPVKERAKKWVPALPASTGIAPGNFEMTTEADESSELIQKLRNIAEIAKGTLEREKVREVACYNCGLACKWTFPLEGGGVSTFKCSSIASAIKTTKIVDCDFALKVYGLLEEYGLDSLAAMQQVALAIDLYEKGILTKEDTDGMHLEFGNPEIVISLLEKITRREGIGDIFANGVYRAAQQIGRGAEKYAHHANKQEPFAFDARGRLKYLLEQAVNDRWWDVSRLESNTTGEFWQAPKEKREKLVKEGWLHFPKEFEKYLLADNLDLTRDDDDINEAFVQVVAYNEETYTLNDANGICYFWGGWWGHSPFRNRAMVADIISSTTGIDIDETEATKIAKRTISLVRAYNAREGLKRDHDNVNDMYFEKLPRPPYLQANRNQVDKWIDRFYELKGRNGEGIPTKKTLDELGLDDVRQDLEQRGILTEKRVATRTR